MMAGCSTCIYVAKHLAHLFVHYIYMYSNLFLINMQIFLNSIFIFVVLSEIDRILINPHTVVFVSSYNVLMKPNFQFNLTFHVVCKLVIALHEYFPDYIGM